MGWGGEAQMNLEVRTKLFEFSIVKLPAIVCDDGVGDAEATYNTLPHKGFDAGPVMVAKASASAHLVKPGRQCGVKARSILGRLPYGPVSMRPNGCRRCLHGFLGGHSDPPLESASEVRKAETPLV
ncbi:hypothetical protein L3X38_042408 [Prunus dulcis]|uniref:Uncharacterized protein n=1 Tax=Prunus dulcis TaxID=3755 RepID=A0AAD4UW87_PRUDU|nr:hypothetical protein L3X38_042408 [Prunus dulcis]